MNSPIVYLVLSIVLCLSLRSAITTSDQGQTINIQMLEKVDDQQCPSTEEIRNQINGITTQVIAGACNGTPGWRRVAFINMTDTSYNCPNGLNLTSYSKRTCGRSHATCTSTTFSVGGLPYRRVCGRIRGYQYGSTSAFGYASQPHNIDSYYVDGVTLTYGTAGNRQHI